MQRREGCRDDQHVLLLQGDARLASARRPDAFVAGTFADREALGGVLVGPDVAPAVEPAEFGVLGSGQGHPQADATAQAAFPLGRTLPAFEHKPLISFAVQGVGLSTRSV